MRRKVDSDTYQRQDMKLAISIEDNTQNADFVTILSSDMIARIVEEYFNKKVYKQQVEVVDAKATEAGYMFSLAFVQQSKKHIVEESSVDNMPLTLRGRNNKGRFSKGNT